MPEATIIPFPTRLRRVAETVENARIGVWDFSAEEFFPEDADPDSRDEIEYRSRRLNCFLTSIATDLTVEQMGLLQRYISDLANAIAEGSFHEGIVEATTPGFSDY